MEEQQTHEIMKMDKEIVPIKLTGQKRLVLCLSHRKTIEVVELL
jgi:hypothetical protein